MPLFSFHRRCRSWSSTRHFRRPTAPLRNVGVLRTGSGRRSPRREPCFDFAQIPHNASWRKREASRELAALFHLVDRAVGERHHLTQSVPPYRSSQRRVDVHAISNSSSTVVRKTESDSCRQSEGEKSRSRAVGGSSAKIGGSEGPSARINNYLHTEILEGCPSGLTCIRQPHGDGPLGRPRIPAPSRNRMR